MTPPEIRYYEESIPSPPPVRVLYSADQGWLVPEHLRPADWREREQPRAYVEEKPKQNLILRAPNVRRPRMREIAARKPKPVRPIRQAAPKEPKNPANRLIADLTPEAILDGWRRGLDRYGIAAEFHCRPQVITRRLMIARTDPDFRALEAEFLLCPRCEKRPKRQFRPLCNHCSKRTGGQRGSNGGHNRKRGCTIEAILDGWKRGLSGRELTEELGCSYTVVRQRVGEAVKDPEYASVLEAIRTCSCGKRKFAHVEVCNRCTQRRKRGQK